MLNRILILVVLIQLFQFINCGILTDSGSEKLNSPHYNPLELILNKSKETYFYKSHNGIRLAYYLKQCHKSDPEVNSCLQKSVNHFLTYMKRGIPELDIVRPEPIIIDEIGIALGSGPNGYRSKFREINAFGFSNMTITAARSDLDTHQFQFTLYVPHISARAKYQSTGVLILVQASGGGDYWGEYEDCRAKIYVKAKPSEVDGKRYLTLQQVKMDFSIKEIQMGVENVHNGNTVIQAALNLFINSNAQDLLKEMKPDLKKNLLGTLTGFIENVFGKIPYDDWIIE